MRKEVLLLLRNIGPWHVGNGVQIGLAAPHLETDVVVGYSWSELDTGFRRQLSRHGIMRIVLEIQHSVATSDKIGITVETIEEILLVKQLAGLFQDGILESRIFQLALYPFQRLALLLVLRRFLLLFLVLVLGPVEFVHRLFRHSPCHLHRLHHRLDFRLRLVANLRLLETALIVIRILNHASEFPNRLGILIAHTTRQTGAQLHGILEGSPRMRLGRVVIPLKGTTFSRHTTGKLPFEETVRQRRYTHVRIVRLLYNPPLMIVAQNGAQLGGIVLLGPVHEGADRQLVLIAIRTNHRPL